MNRRLTSATTLDNLRKEARRWLKSLHARDSEARRRLERAYPRASARPSLREVQHALAREHGLENWKELKLAVERAAAELALAQTVQSGTAQSPSSPVAYTRAEYQQAAQDFVRAYDGDASALQRLNRHYLRSFTREDLEAEIWRRVYAFRQRAFKGSENHLDLAEARTYPRPGCRFR